VTRRHHGRLTKLLPQHHVLLESVRDDWMRQTLCADPADRQAAEEGLRSAYRLLDRRPPERIVWADSPTGAATALREVLPAERFESSRDPFLGIASCASNKMWVIIRNHVRYETRFRVQSRIRTTLWMRTDLLTVHREWGSSEWSDVHPDPAVRLLSADVHDVGWAYAYSAQCEFYSCMGVPGMDAWDCIAQLLRSAGAFWTLPDAAILCERPVVVRTDDEGQIHCSDGPAIVYRDGTEVFVWHDRLIPPWVVTEELTVPRILQEANAEIRRIATERYGWDALIADSGMTLVAEADDPGNAPHTLTLWELPTSLAGLFEGPVRILLCTNGSSERDGTRRRFGLPVRAHHADPVAAAAELYDIPVEDYRRLSARR
jgi:hypothetical protein